ncbi:dihydroorotase [Robiginitalea sp. M366]|uniref:dihydroorotase n=1 Tax=Robiginitalea aestuariiviva TaxID=3036903 RepID=UPI00240D2653|nr:dihydroorotase [Robiginitalea aestuariiviva]MDG1573019.1 dihydroorotase [Robiginitalea aestuariiviva]
MKLVLKSATLVTPGQPGIHGKKRDLLIENGRIAKIAANLDTPEGVPVITLKNLHVSPGWFDHSVSFGEPGFEERETISNGLKVAASSGFTGIVLNPDTRPVPDTSGDVVFLREAARESVAELFPLGALSLGRQGVDLAELYDMHGAGAVGFSDGKHPVENPSLLKLALLYAQHFKGLIYSFPLDGQMAPKGQMHEGETSVRLGLKGIPALAEELRVARDLRLLEYTGGKLHIPTISTAQSVSLIAAARKKGMDVSCGVALHHLFFTDEELSGFDSRFKVLPPLRGKADVKALRKALAEGTIDFVTSDHSPKDIEEKRLEFDRAAFGSLGLESAFGILSRIYPLELCVEILTRGRERFGLPAVALEEGQRANLTLFNPEGTRTLQEADLASTSKNSMYIGQELQGSVYGVVVGDKTQLA